MTERPNILFIFTDQQSARAMHCADNDDLSTPAMDSLARDGIRFSRTYCTQPLCSPSRASLFSGEMPHTAGVTRNGLAMHDHVRARGIGHVLREAGYACAYGGKWHVPEISLPEGHGFEQIAPFGDPGLTEACVEYLRQPPAQPFFLVASFDNPHNICEWARRQPLPWGPISASPLEECPNLPVNFAPPSFEPEIIRLEQRANPMIHPTTSFSEEEWRQYRDAYYRLVEKVDAQVGRLLEALRESGQAENTLVIFSSDHGDGHGAHRWNQKSVLYEEVVRVPLLVSAPGVMSRDITDDTHLISNGLDLFPTLCDYAGVDVPDDLPGLSLRPLIEGRVPARWREQLVVETIFDGNRGYGATGRMLRTARYKYVVYSMGRQREQLFDLDADPGEMVNLAVEARYRGILDDHRRRLTAWCAETADPFARLLGQD